MTVVDLRWQLRKIGYDVPLEMFTKVWTKAATQRIYKYTLWRLALHRKSGHPMIEPPMLTPFYKPSVTRQCDPEVPLRHRICWTLNNARREIK
jgi:hypothetical protein